MTISALAEAAQVTSDNVAANLLLARLGGPTGFTARLRELGDRQTRLDRLEPELNLVLPGDERDTTTPRAMAETASRLLTGDVLTPASREQLIDWMVKTRTGDRRIRAGLPKDWRAGDKTGTATADTHDGQDQRRGDRVPSRAERAGCRGVLRQQPPLRGDTRSGSGRAGRGRPAGGGFLTPIIRHHRRRAIRPDRHHRTGPSRRAHQGVRADPHPEHTPRFNPDRSYTRARAMRRVGDARDR